ncbi:MAG: hypothetical protein M1831_004709 [Alyxoria varia]|nr:MAG: hypothetical protein M1831_004709 [Alyxoria varia]
MKSMATTLYESVFRYLNKTISAIKDNPSYAIIPTFCIAGVIYRVKSNRLLKNVQYYDDFTESSLATELDETAELETSTVPLNTTHCARATVVYRPHPKASQLPKNLPLIVVLEDPHDLWNGSQEVPGDQFGHLAPRIWGSAPCLFIRLPRYNRVADTDLMRRLILALIEGYETHPGVVFVSFGSGCEVVRDIDDERVKGLVQICPEISRIRFGDFSKPELVIAENNPQFPTGSFRVNNKPRFRTPLLRRKTSHTVLYVPKAYKAVSALIHRFLADEIDPHLSRGWQMQQTSKPQESKWNAKSLKKWKETQAVSEPIGQFRAMKTMRDDDDHCPENLAKNWDDIIAVLDISSTDPLYTPSDLQVNGNVIYSKFPSESKYVPSQKEVQTFIEKVKSIMANNPKDGATLAVHCHYGFNRTGFFIVSYLVEQEAWKVEDAIHEFSIRRSPGLKHMWFEDELHLRYCERW